MTTDTLDKHDVVWLLSLAREDIKGAVPDPRERAETIRRWEVVRHTHRQAVAEHAAAARSSGGDPARDDLWPLPGGRPRMDEIAARATTLLRLALAP